MTNYKTLIPKLIARNNPDALADAFEVCRELEMENAVIVQGHGKRDYGTTVYDGIQVITPSRKGQNGTEMLNTALQEAINKAMAELREEGFFEETAAYWFGNGESAEE
mgnify:CR=1 FL=1